jgi:uncharacterized protein
VNFEWNARRGKSDLAKHGVDFADAARVFLDPHRIEIYDGTEAPGEDRWKTIGLVEVVPLVVVYTIRGQDGDIIRLISARKADSHERTQYGQI